MAVITLAVGALGWSVTLPGTPGAVADGSERAQPAPRSRPVAALAAVTGVRIAIDGLEMAADAVPGQAVRDVLGMAGITLEPTDRLSVDPDAAVVPGMRIALDRGQPLTLVDGGATTATRAARGTVRELLAARRIDLGPQDRLSAGLDDELAPGAVLRITRVSGRQVTERAEGPFPVQRVPDPDINGGEEVVQRPGVPAELERVWAVTYLDGIESARVLLSETVVKEAVAEVRLLGTRAFRLPPPPAEIERIIRDAASRYGANPDQLLRVAYCESRYNPYAYNPSAGDSGLFQFIPGTWRSNAPRAGYAGASPFDAVANANTAAMLFAEGKAWMWTCK